MKYAIYLMIGLGFLMAVDITNDTLPEKCRVEIGVVGGAAVVFAWPTMVTAMSSLYVIDVPDEKTECDYIIDQMRESRK